MEKRKRKNSCSDDEDPAAVIESQGKKNRNYHLPISLYFIRVFQSSSFFFSSRTCTKNCEMCKTIVKSSGGIKVKKSKLLYLRCESWKVVKTSLNIRVEYVFPIYKLVTFCCGPFHFPILFQLPFHCYLKYYFGLYKVLFMVNRICLMRLYWG